MRKLPILILLAVVASCAPAKTVATGKKPLYEILTQQQDGGASIRFYEVLSEPNEIKMLLGDEHLKHKISSTDTSQATFIILNMGEKPSAGYSITVADVAETADKIIVTVADKEPGADAMSASVIKYPYTIVKINSKKQLEIK